MLRQDLGLAVQRAVVSIFRDDDMGCWLDRPPAISAPVPVPAPRPWQVQLAYLGPARHDHLVLRRDNVEPLRTIFADHMRRAAPAYAAATKIGRKPVTVTADAATLRQSLRRSLNGAASTR